MRDKEKSEWTAPDVKTNPIIEDTEGTALGVFEGETGASTGPFES